ncbi:substrate-binding domain-containing protein [candidate division KSB1 bacterium]|nr:substrate-binding domain-containing protein [candidate division KSB1 bacterium]
MHTKRIGIIVPELKHTFFAAILDGIQDAASEEGFIICVGQSKEDYRREKTEIESLLLYGIDGLLVSVSQNTKKTDHFQRVLDESIPLVFFDRVCQNLNTSYVVVDDFDGAFKATEHLILSGYKQIAHIGGPQFISNMKNRYKGYQAALKKYEFPFQQELVVFGNLDEDSGTIGMKTLLKLSKNPDAVFAVNDPVAIGALFQIKKAGLNIHDDIALVGFSDNPIAALIDPPLTTVAQPRYEIGRIAAKMLIDQINNNSMSSPPIERVLKTKLIIRQSS